MRGSLGQPADLFATPVDEAFVHDLCQGGFGLGPAVHIALLAVQPELSESFKQIQEFKALHLKHDILKTGTSLEMRSNRPVFPSSFASNY